MCRLTVPPRVGRDLWNLCVNLWVCVYVGGVVDGVEYGLFLESRCIMGVLLVCVVGVLGVVLSV